MSFFFLKEKISVLNEIIWLCVWERDNQPAGIIYDKIIFVFVFFFSSRGNKNLFLFLFFCQNKKSLTLLNCLYIHVYFIFRPLHLLAAADGHISIYTSLYILLHNYIYLACLFRLFFQDIIPPRPSSISIFFFFCKQYI